jgi:hypothetical protein
VARRGLLLAALGGTVAASVGLALQPDVAPEIVTPRAAIARAAAPIVGPAPAPAPRAAWPEPRPQALLAWGPPPAPPAPARPASAPGSAPPPEFPYRWIGRLDDGDVAQALLSGPQRSIGARAGDVLDGRWRVDRVDTSRLELTWLPTGDAVAIALPR